MTKEKLWRKKRTSRGRSRNENAVSRVVKNAPKISRKNLSREVFKNQKWYSRYFLKYIFCGILALIWLRTPLNLPLINYIFPIGFLLGLIIIANEKSSVNRWVEFAILIAFASLSFFTPIGIVF